MKKTLMMFLRRQLKKQMCWRDGSGEARREVLEDLMDIENAKKVLDWISQGKISVQIKKTKIASPFATNLVLQGYSDLIKIEDRQEFLKRMHAEHLKIIKEKGE